MTAAPATEANADTAVVDAGSTQSISVSAKAPNDEASGAHKVVVRALGGPEPVEMELTVNLTGTFDMSLGTSDQRLNANVTAGGTSTLDAHRDQQRHGATSPGSKCRPRRRAIGRSPSRPRLSTSPQVQTANVTATITASGSALAGDYVIAMTARSADSSATDTVSIRTTVETSPIGYIIGIARPRRWWVSACSSSSSAMAVAEVAPEQTVDGRHAPAQRSAPRG